MRCGGLLIKVPNSKSADKFLKASYIDNIQIIIQMHRSLNTTLGRIFSRKFIDITEEELLLAFEEHKVVEIHKILRKEGDKIVSIGATIVDCIRHPEILKIGLETVDENIPTSWGV